MRLDANEMRSTSTKDVREVGAAFLDALMAREFGAARALLTDERSVQDARSERAHDRRQRRRHDRPVHRVGSPMPSRSKWRPRAQARSKGERR